MKKIIRILSVSFVFTVMLFCGILLSSCCSPKPCEVKVTFVGADERLELEDYSYYVDFSETSKVSFTVPKGYDHTKISGSISGVSVPFEVQYKQGEIVEEGYEYTLDKEITFVTNFVKRDFELIIDLTQMLKLKFDITLANGMENFQAFLINKEKTEKFFTSFNESDVISKVNFVNNKASIEYGNYVVLVHNKVVSKINYDSLYSEVNHYTNANNLANVGSINYSYYKRAKKGNADYVFNSNPNTALYYFGEIKESVNLYTKIPNYVEDRGFQIDRKPNTFYLFTNLSEYNSDLLTMQAYTTTNKVYNSTDANMDRINGKVVEKVDPSAIYSDRYDVHKIYLGNNLDEDVLVDNADKSTLNKELFFVVSSSMDLSNINFYLLNDEYERTKNAYTIAVNESLTDKGNYYISFSSEDLAHFSLDRDYVATNGTIYNYQTGLAILYPEVDYNFFGAHKLTDYMRIFKNINIINTDSEITANDLHLNFYLKDDDGNIKYGLTDSHFWPNDMYKRDCVYFNTTDIFDYNAEDGLNYYKNNLYLEIRGKEYTNFRSVTINYVTIYSDTEALADGQVNVENYKDYNGIKDFKVRRLIYRDLGEYTINIYVSLNGTFKEPTTLDFSFAQMPNIYTQGVYMTDNPLFASLADFSFIGGGNKDTFNSLSFSYVKDLYYFTNTSDSTFDIEIRLDPNDPTTTISTSQNFCDIMGNVITMEINGEKFYIKVIKQDTIYELLDSGKMYVVKKGA